MNNEFLTKHFTVEDDRTISCKKCQEKFKFADGIDQLYQHLKVSHSDVL